MAQAMDYANLAHITSQLLDTGTIKAVDAQHFINAKRFLELVVQGELVVMPKDQVVKPRKRRAPVKKADA